MTKISILLLSSHSIFLILLNPAKTLRLIEGLKMIFVGHRHFTRRKNTSPGITTFTKANHRYWSIIHKKNSFYESILLQKDSFVWAKDSYFIDKPINNNNILVIF